MKNKLQASACTSVMCPRPRADAALHSTAKPLRAGSTCDSDEAGHAFQYEAGHPFRDEAGHGSDLKPAS
jgi:hypothetical protein